MLPQPGRPLEAPYGFVVALAAEARAFGRPVALGRPRALAAGQWLGVSGMGAERARHMALDLVSRGVRGLVSFGTCAGLAPGLAAGTLVCPRAVRDEQGAYEASWPQALVDALPAAVPIDVLVSVSRPVGGVADKADLVRRYGASAVDMESVALARVAHDNELAFLAVRVVVDPFDAPVPEGLMHGLDAWGRPRVGALLAALGIDARQWRALWRLGRDFAKARPILAQAAGVLTGRSSGGRVLSRQTDGG
ncbi:hypothetical protein [Acidiferrobacter sp. SPIII_3]|uniref:phosphorylase family protein n=1 Tax=Acidiferrobacter sp. SPIII_3 TaxID=1281578 RepID=UPI0011AB4D95|nr:hypothetical protein [Acidiferrobacter sp. SPIII_3]